jgi:hypothetical protein
LTSLKMPQSSKYWPQQLVPSSVQGSGNNATGALLTPAIPPRTTLLQAQDHRRLAWM